MTNANLELYFKLKKKKTKKEGISLPVISSHKHFKICTTIL